MVPAVPHTAFYRANLWRWLAATGLVAVLTGCGLHLVLPCGTLYRAALHPLIGKVPLLVDAPTALAALAPLALIGAHLLQTAFYVAFRREGLLADLDREWLARASGLALRIGIVGACAGVSCLMIPALVQAFVDDQSASRIWTMLYTGGSTVAIGGPAAWLGKELAARVEALAGQSGKSLTWLLNVLAALFAIQLLATSGGAVEFLLGLLQASLQYHGANSVLAAIAGPQTMRLPLLLQVITAVGLSALFLCFGRVNINRFSMHAVYRNRLVRAFLGTARDKRAADPFTGFDQHDNLRLASFRQMEARQRLFPVINITLNVTSSSNSAWAERKAESFVATPLRCGAGALHRREQAPDGSPNGAFVRTTAYAGKDSRFDEMGADRGATIGTMLTISGAALSPSWGYHSSPASAFLMTLFNVRLGAWMPNPANSTDDELQLAKANDSLVAHLSDLAGITTDNRQAIYLSDGGHFENLGLYEMLRRRCRLIVVVDAGQDEKCSFFDLGNAIRKARIDLGANVRMRTMRIRSRQAIESNPGAARDAIGFAVGCIDYPSGPRGRLVYLKPSFLPDIPADVRAYGLANASFPHVTNTEQWFTESEFESYRALGAWQMQQLTEKMVTGTLRDLFAAADEGAALPDKPN